MISLLNIKLTLEITCSLHAIYWNIIFTYVFTSCNTVKTLKIRTPEKYTVIILKFDLYEFSIELCVQTI